ncbi:hypothetical protein N7499_013350, partial [Penicillium canescens]
HEITWTPSVPHYAPAGARRPTPAPTPALPALNPPRPSPRHFANSPAPPTGYLPRWPRPGPHLGRDAPPERSARSWGLGPCQRTGGWSRITGAKQVSTQPGHPHMARP